MVIINSIYNDVSKQGLGNRLFQYCWAREIAERKGYMLESNTILGFPITYNILEGTQKFNNLLSTPEGTQLFDMESIYEHDGQILVKGYSQRYEFYVENKENIKRWLFIENEKIYETPDSDDIVLNIRLGDYVGLGWDLPMDYYVEILKKETYKNAIIVCDEPNNPKLSVLKEMGCVVKDNSNHGKMKFIADFVFVKNAKKCVIANSTFSWWATFLGNADRIYYPCIKFPWIPNPEKDDVDLRVYDEERYVFITNM
jgi:hypothetical protein